MAVPRDHIAALRAFNRFYTRIIGVVDDSILQSPYSLPEARVIYETGRRGTVTAGELAQDLDMDRGQMSRLVWRLSDRNVLAITPASDDRRANTLALTREGERAAADLDELSDMAAEALLSPLPDAGRQALIAAMQTITRSLGAAGAPGPVTLRPHRVGELGWLIHRQGVLYNREHGWNAEFEALIARIYSEYETAPEAPPKKLWVAEQDGQVAGSVFVVPAEAAGIAQLRMLYVEPAARGQGLGHTLVGEAVRFAREAGYRRMMLWTQDCLRAARRVYRAAGFTLESENRHRSFGADLNGQYWTLDLTAQ